MFFICFEKEDASPANGGTTSSSGGENNYSAEWELAPTIGEAFAGAETPVDKVLTGKWTGWYRISDIWGKINEDIVDASAKCDYTNNGRKYSKVYRNYNMDSIVLSMYIEDEATDKKIIPVVGDQDAWMAFQYLDEYSAVDFENEINADGRLYFYYDFQVSDGGCTFEIFLRKEGTEWQDYDLLPPSMQ